MKRMDQQIHPSTRTLISHPLSHLPLIMDQQQCEQQEQVSSNVMSVIQCPYMEESHESSLEVSSNSLVLLLFCIRVSMSF